MGSTLSRELQTIPLPALPVPVGYSRSHDWLTISFLVWSLILTMINQTVTLLSVYVSHVVKRSRFHRLAIHHDDFVMHDLKLADGAHRYARVH